MKQEPLSADLPPASSVPVSGVPNELPEAMRPAYRRRGPTERNYHTEQVLDRIAPVQQVEGCYTITVRCGTPGCEEQVTVSSTEEPGQLARAVVAGFCAKARLTSGVVCDKCGGL